MLMQLTAENHAIQIKKYREKVVPAFFVEWTSFYRDLSPQSRRIVLDIFHAAGILTSKATQFEKLPT